jgi:hypothetical protein
VHWAAAGLAAATMRPASTAPVSLALPGVMASPQKKSDPGQSARDRLVCTLAAAV